MAQIRLAHAHDAEAIAAIYRPFVEGTSISFETIPPDREEMAGRIMETIAFYPWLVCEVEGRVAGYAYATRHRVRAAYQWSVDSSVYVAAEDLALRDRARVVRLVVQYPGGAGVFQRLRWYHVAKSRQCGPA